MSRRERLTLAALELWEANRQRVTELTEQATAAGVVVPVVLVEHDGNELRVELKGPAAIPGQSLEGAESFTVVRVADLGEVVFRTAVEP